MNGTTQQLRTYVVWMHAGGKIKAVAEFAERGLADAYANYSNKRHAASWFEVRWEESSK